MFTQLVRFEWHYFAKQPSFYVTLALFFILPFLASSLDSVGMGGGNLLKNGPFTLGRITVFFNLLSMFLIINFVASTAIRDMDSKMTGLLYSKPISPITYQLGRLTGSTSVALFVVAMVPLGMFIGSLMPWANPERFGPINPTHYLNAYSFFAVPTVITFSLIIFALALRFKSMMAVYLAAVAIFIGFELSDGLDSVSDNAEMAALLDPFANQTFDHITRYWTITEKNTGSFEFTGILLQSRLLWLGIGMVFFLTLGGLSNRFYRDEKIKKAKTSKLTLPQDNLRIHFKGAPHAPFHPFIARCVFEVRHTLFSPAFMILTAMILFIHLSVLAQPPRELISPLWPLTQFMIDGIQQTLSFLVPIVITYYCGEIIWRERQDGIDDIIGSMPVSNAVLWTSKLLALVLLVTIILIFSSLITMLFQTENGLEYIDISQYLGRLSYFTLLPWLMMIVLAITMQVLSPNKYVGMFWFVLFLVSGFLLDNIGLTSNLYRFGQSPDFIYSDMNGFGRALLSHSWFMLYWGSLTIVLGIVGYSLWHRGPHQTLKTRFPMMRDQLGKQGKWVTAGALLVFVFSGITIYYNTRVLNQYADTDMQLLQRVAYEKQFTHLENSPYPTITKVSAKVDIFPQQLRIEASAEITVQNTSNSPIEKFIVTLPNYSPDVSVIIEGGELRDEAGPHNTYWFEFKHPMLPGESRTGSLGVIRQHQGFLDGDEDISLVENGTAIDNSELFPLFGYFPQLEIIDPLQRRSYGLPPPKRANKLDDTRFHTQNAIGGGYGFIDFEAVISTSLDQTAIAPGYLQREWQQNQRRYFHYKMDAPILNFYSFVSARLEAYVEEYDGISIEVFVHPDHAMNVETVKDALKDSIDYFTEHFGPYQHRQVRVIEIPRYRNFAQSFANTIPYPEHGLLTDLRDPDTLNTLFDITSHEMAHQWWAHQVGSANVQGSAVLSETLAEYSALLVDAKRFGEDKMRHYMKVELNRYLRGRTREVVEEMPLMLAENQPYIHYQKGAMVMMRLRDELGEEHVNKALRKLLETFKFKTDPYPTTRNLIANLKHNTSAKQRQLIDDLFKRITLYDLKVTQTKVTALDEHQYQVTLEIDGQRFESDGAGNGTPITLDHDVDIGLFLDNPDDSHQKDNRLYLEKHRIVQGNNTINIVLQNKPTFVVVDPYLRLIDRDSADNSRRIE